MLWSWDTLILDTGWAPSWWSGLCPPGRLQAYYLSGNVVLRWSWLWTKSFTVCQTLDDSTWLVSLEVSSCAWWLRARAPLLDAWPGGGASSLLLLFALLWLASDSIHRNDFLVTFASESELHTLPIRHKMLTSVKRGSLATLTWWPACTVITFFLVFIKLVSDEPAWLHDTV